MKEVNMIKYILSLSLKESVGLLELPWLYSTHQQCAVDQCQWLINQLVIDSNGIIILKEITDYGLENILSFYNPHYRYYNNNGRIAVFKRLSFIISAMIYELSMNLVEHDFTTLHIFYLLMIAFDIIWYSIILQHLIILSTEDSF